MRVLKQFRRGAVSVFLTLAVPAGAQQAPDPDYIPGNLEALEQSFDACMAAHDKTATHILSRGTSEEIEELLDTGHKAEMKIGGTRIGSCTRDFAQLAGERDKIDPTTAIREVSCRFHIREAGTDRNHTFYAHYGRRHVYLTLDYGPVEGTSRYFLTTYRLENGKLFRVIDHNGENWETDAAGKQRRIRRLPVHPDKALDSLELVPKGVEERILPLMQSLHRRCQSLG